MKRLLAPVFALLVVGAGALAASKPGQFYERVIPVADENDTPITYASPAGSVTAAGTSGSQAQAIQGITGGVAVPVSNTASVPDAMPWGTTGGTATSAAVLGPGGTPAVIDTSGYSVVSVQLIGPFVGNVAYEVSNDAANFQSKAGPSSASYGTGNDFIADGSPTIREFSISERYLQIRATSYTSGTIKAVVTLKANGAVGPKSVYVGSGSVTALPTQSAGTNRSATVGTAASTLMAANTSRRGWKIKNDSSGDIWINFDATATAAAGSGNIKIAAGTYLASEPGFVETGAMSVIGSAAGLAITAREH